MPLRDTFLTLVSSRAETPSASRRVYSVTRDAELELAESFGLGLSRSPTRRRETVQASTWTAGPDGVPGIALGGASGVASLDERFLRFSTRTSSRFRRFFTASSPAASGVPIRRTLSQSRDALQLNQHRDIAFSNFSHQQAEILARLRAKELAESVDVMWKGDAAAPRLYTGPHVGRADGHGGGRVRAPTGRFPDPEKAARNSRSRSQSFYAQAEAQVQSAPSVVAGSVQRYPSFFGIGSVSDAEVGSAEVELKFMADASPPRRDSAFEPAVNPARLSLQLPAEIAATRSHASHGPYRHQCMAASEPSLALDHQRRSSLKRTVTAGSRAWSTTSSARSISWGVLMIRHEAKCSSSSSSEGSTGKKKLGSGRRRVVGEVVVPIQPASPTARSGQSGSGEQTSVVSMPDNAPAAQSAATETSADGRGKWSRFRRRVKAILTEPS